LGFSQKDFAQLAVLGLGEFRDKAKQNPIKLAFDLERGSADIEAKLKAAFDKFKISAGSIIDVNGLESVLGKLSNPDQIIQGLQKVVDKANEIRTAISGAFQVDQQIATVKGEVDQLFSEIDKREGVRNTVGGGLGQKLKDELTSAKEALKTLGTDSFITPEELQRAQQAVAAYKQTADSNKISSIATTTTQQALSGILDKFRQISDLQQKATNVAPLQQSLAPLNAILDSVNPKLQTTAQTLAVELNPRAESMKLALQASDSATLGINTSLSLAKSNAEAIASAAAQTAASYSAAAASASAISGGNDDPTTAAYGRYLNNPKYMAAGGVMPRGMDTIPVMARAGETIIDPNNSRKFFSQIQSIRAGKPPIFRSEGGSVTNVGDISVSIDGSKSPEMTARTVARKLRREFKRGTSRL